MRCQFSKCLLFGLLLVVGSFVQVNAQVLMLDFDDNGFGEGPFGPAHGDFDGEGVLDDATDVVWNLIGSDDVDEDIVFSDGSDATGVSIDLGTATDAPDLTIDWENTDFATRTGNGPQIFQDGDEGCSETTDYVESVGTWIAGWYNE